VGRTRYTRHNASRTSSLLQDLRQTAMMETLQLTVGANSLARGRTRYSRHNASRTSSLLQDLCQTAMMETLQLTVGANLLARAERGTPGTTPREQVRSYRICVKLR